MASGRTGDGRPSRAHRLRDCEDARLADTAWRRRGYTAQDVLHQAVTILRDADRAFGREHDPSRVRGWHDLLRRSPFTPAGTQLLRQRLRLAEAIGDKVS